MRIIAGQIVLPPNFVLWVSSHLLLWKLCHVSSRPNRCLFFIYYYAQATQIKSQKNTNALQTRLPFIRRRTISVCIYDLTTFLLMWAWPWTNDLDIRTWRSYSEDILMRQNEVSRSRFSKVRERTWQTNIQTQRDRRNRTHYQPYSWAVIKPKLGLYYKMQLQL